MIRSLGLSLLVTVGAATGMHAQAQEPAGPPTPTDVKPGSITCDECPYPYPSKYLDISVYDQDVRMAYMDTPAQGTPNGHTVLLLHGNNFGGFYFKAIIDGLTKEGFRVITPDQIGYGRSSKPIAPYNFNSQVRNTYRILQHEKIERVMVIGHSMGGMMAARFATQFPKATEKVVIYNPIGLTDGRYDRPLADIDAAYKSSLGQTYQSIRASLMRYVAHNPSAWNDVFETYAKVRYSWTLGPEWPRLALVQALIGQVQYVDPVVYDWARIKSPTLVFGGADDFLAGTPADFQAAMKRIAETIPNNQARLHLIAGLGHVPHLEAPDKTYPPLVAFLKEGLTPRL
jgi:pimeloyl-ACP methyl ester carboxylesterase